MSYPTSLQTGITYTEYQAQNPTLAQEPSEVQYQVAREYFDKQMAKQPGWKDEAPEVQEQVWKQFQIKHNVPEVQHLQEQGRSTAPVTPAQMFTAGAPGMAFYNAPTVTDQDKFNQGQLSGLSAAVKGATLGYFDPYNPNLGKQSEEIRGIPEFAGQTIPMELAGMGLDSLVKNTGIKLLPSAVKGLPFARPALNAVTKLQDKSLLSNMVKGALSFGGYGAAESVPDHQFDLSARAQNAFNSGLMGAAFPLAIEGGGKLLGKALNGLGHLLPKPKIELPAPAVTRVTRKQTKPIKGVPVIGTMARDTGKITTNAAAKRKLMTTIVDLKKQGRHNEARLLVSNVTRYMPDHQAAAFKDEVNKAYSQTTAKPVKEHITKAEKFDALVAKIHEMRKQDRHKEADLALKGYTQETKAKVYDAVKRKEKAEKQAAAAKNLADKEQAKAAKEKARAEKKQYEADFKKLVEEEKAAKAHKAKLEAEHKKTQDLKRKEAIEAEHARQKDEAAARKKQMDKLKADIEARHKAEIEALKAEEAASQKKQRELEAQGRKLKDQKQKQAIKDQLALERAESKNRQRELKQLKAEIQSRTNEQKKKAEQQDGTEQPATKIEDIKSNKPLTLKGFRVESDKKLQGTGTHYGLTEESVEHYKNRNGRGQKVTKRDITLKKPFVIKSDYPFQFLEYKTDAGSTLQEALVNAGIPKEDVSRITELYKESKKTKPSTLNPEGHLTARDRMLKAELEKYGFDGIVFVDQHNPGKYSELVTFNETTSAQKPKPTESKKPSEQAATQSKGQAVRQSTNAKLKEIRSAIDNKHDLELEYEAEKTGETGTYRNKRVSPYSVEINKNGVIQMRAINEEGQIRTYLLGDESGSKIVSAKSTKSPASHEIFNHPETGKQLARNSAGQPVEQIKKTGIKSSELRADLAKMEAMVEKAKAGKATASEIKEASKPLSENDFKEKTKDLDGDSIDEHCKKVLE